MSNPVATHRLPDGREVRTLARTMRNSSVKLHTSPHEGKWLWSYSVMVNHEGSSSLPFPDRPHQPPMPTEDEALRAAATAVLERLESLPKAPRALREWVEGILEPKQAALFEAAP